MKYPKNYFDKASDGPVDWMECGAQNIPLESYRIGGSRIHVVIPFSNGAEGQPESLELFVVCTAALEGIRRESDEIDTQIGTMNKGLSHIDYDSVFLTNTRIISPGLIEPAEISLRKGEPLYEAIMAKVSEIFDEEDWESEI